MPGQTLLSWGRVLQFEFDFLDIDDRFACLPELPAGASSLCFSTSPRHKNGLDYDPWDRGLGPPTGGS